MSRLLLLDDEPSVVQSLQRTMRRGLPGTVKVEGFDDPYLALSRAGEVAFDVIISDFRMPRMDGLSFLRQVRQTQPKAIRLVLSASAEVEIVTRAINDVEVFRYLVKPWVEKELLDHIRAALEKSESLKQDHELANQMRLLSGQISPQDAEVKRLEAEEPGITQVEWGPNGEVLMPDLDASFVDEDVVWPRTTKK
jgi:YesN/AraC family two-component response regulator